MITQQAIQLFDLNVGIYPSHKGLEYLVEWITQTGELPLISGFKRKELDLINLKEWLDTALHFTITSFNNNIIGLSTLSTQEAELPHDTIEVCHTIVKPEFRRLYNGATMILKSSSLAKQEGYKRVVGRVAKINEAGMSLLNNLRWSKIENKNFSDDVSVTWFEKRFI